MHFIGSSIFTQLLCYILDSILSCIFHTLFSKIFLNTNTLHPIHTLSSSCPLTFSSLFHPTILPSFTFITSTFRHISLPTGNQSDIKPSVTICPVDFFYFFASFFIKLICFFPYLSIVVKAPV